MNKFLLESPRWAFFVLLVLTPWAWGGIPVWIEMPIAKTCVMICIAHILIGLGKRNLALPPVIMILASLWILLQGWWMVYNAHYQPIPQFHVTYKLTQHNPTWPGSFNRSDSLRLMWMVTALMLALYIVYDISCHKVWRKRLIMTLLLAGGSVAAFGMIERIQSVSGIWPDVDRNNYPFGTFYYHGNAAAYMNTVLPVSLACLLRSLFAETKSLTMAALVCLALLLISGTIVCASKAGMIVAIGLSILMMLIFWMIFHGRLDQTTFNLPPYFMMLLVIAMVSIMIIFIGKETILQRWHYAWGVGDFIISGRKQTAEICYKALPEAGWFGFGPGTFSTIFPYAATLQKVTLTGFWQNAHEDYLQTVLEWGKVGAAAWSLLFFGSIVRVLTSQRFWREVRRYDRVLMMGLLLSILGCAVHSLVDFPLQITAIQLNTAVVMGLLWAAPHWESNSRVRRHRRRAKKGIIEGSEPAQ